MFDKYRKAIMSARLLVAVGRIQKSPEGIVHIMVHHLIDRSAELRRLAEPELPMLATPIKAPDERSRSSHGHPRNVRILPASRDFH